MTKTTPPPLVEAKNLKQYFPLDQGFFKGDAHVRAVDNISFQIPKGATFGIVGESGSGKTTAARTILRLIQPTGGQLFYDGTEITGLSAKDMRPFRRKMQIIAQDPYNSLHPRKLIKNIIGEGLKIHFKMGAAEQVEVIGNILNQVGLKKEHMFRYPHEFSGGQRQRISVARALVLRPEFLVLDEPTSALDVSVQAVILKMLRDLKAEFGLTYMFITHDLAVIDYIADHLAVMYLGQIMETGTKDDLFNRPAHPYTQLLLSAILYPDPAKKKRRATAVGEIPSPVHPPSGCKFHTRCPYKKDICEKEEPREVRIAETHGVKCHFPLAN